jgi:hypothetical protein
MTDPLNCGSCGHDCQGGACELGACIAVGGPTVLASDQASPGSIVVDDRNVYWVDRGPVSGSMATIMSCAKTGCGHAPTVLAAGPWSDVTNLAIGGGHVTWGAAGQIFTCSVGGCNGAPTVLWSGGEPIGSVTADDAGVFFGEEGAPVVHPCPLAGCADAAGISLAAGAASAPLLAIAAATGALAIAVDDENLYAVLNGQFAGGVVACAQSDCTDSLRLLAGNGTSLLPLLAVDATQVYFATIELTVPPGGPPGFVGFPGSANSSSSIGFASKGSNPETGGTLLDGLSAPSAIAVDSQSLYVAVWGDMNDAGVRPAGSGRLARCALTGCGDVATTVQDYLSYPQGVAVDDAHVYWTDFGSGTDPIGTSGGRVMVVAK